MLRNINLELYIANKNITPLALLDIARGRCDSSISRVANKDLKIKLKQYESEYSFGCIVALPMGEENCAVIWLSLQEHRIRQLITLKTFL